MGELGRKAGTTRGGENQDKDNNNTANDDEVVTQSKELYRKQLREQHFRCVPLYPGQGGFNPCVCWTWCCGGRCTLRTGCYLTAFLLTNIGLFYVAYSLPKVTNFVITTSGSNLKPESVENQKEFRTTFEKYFADIEVLLGFLASSSIFSIFAFTWGCLFSILPGILLAIASAKLSRIACFLYLVLMVLGLGFLLGAAIAVSATIINRQFSFINPDFKIWTILVIWVTAYVTIALRVYFFLCGYGIFAQIRDGEYKMPRPPKQQAYFLAPSSF